MLPWQALEPRAHFGCSVADAFGGSIPPPAELQRYMQLYGQEGHVLVWRDSAAYVLLKDGGSASSSSSSQQQHADGMHVPLSSFDAGGGDGAGSLSSADDAPPDAPTAAAKSAAAAAAGRQLHSTTLLRAMYQAAWLAHHRPAATAGDHSALAASLQALQRDFPAFAAGLAAGGWDLSSVPFKAGSVRLRVVQVAAAAAAVSGTSE